MNQNPLAMAAGNTLMLTVTLAVTGMARQIFAWLGVLTIGLSIFIDPNLTTSILLIVMSIGGFVAEYLKLTTEDKATEIAESLMASLTGAMNGPTMTDMQASYDTEAAPNVPKSDWPTDQ